MLNRKNCRLHIKDSKNAIGVIVNETKKNTEDIVSQIKAIAKKYNKEVIVIDFDIRSNENMIRARKLLKNALMFISIGGDGTLLSAVKIAIKYNVAVLPIYHGTLGFIAEILPSEAYLILEEYLNGESTLYTIERRLCLSVKIKYVNKKIHNFYAINDLVIAKPEGRPIHLCVEISGRVISSLVGDGVVIATPTGSTAYALSAGGPILTPSLKALAFVPIAPHSLTLRPLIIPCESDISITLNGNTEKAIISIDGDSIATITKEDIVTTTSSGKNFFLFQSSSRKFYDTLRDKLNWGI